MSSSIHSQDRHVGLSAAEQSPLRQLRLPKVCEMVGRSSRSTAIDRGRTLEGDSLAQTDTAQRGPWVLPVWMAFLRPAHWSKNLLVAVPPVFAHLPLSLDLSSRVAAGIVAMSLAASAGYIINDLKDAAFDRLHAHKRQRPIAQGIIRPASALAAVLGLIATSLGIAASLLGSTATWMIVAYLGATIAYSSYFRRVAGADILVLAGLYIWRLLIGGEIAGTPLSAWLGAA